MARIKGPMFSTSAAGRVASIMTFGRAVAGPLARAQLRPINKPPPPDWTPGQQTRRELYQAGVAAWHALTPEEKQPWHALGKIRHLTGFNCFMSAALTVPAPPLGTIWDDGTTTWDSGATTWDV